jgi:hypothetical protein
MCSKQYGDKNAERKVIDKWVENARVVDSMLIRGHHFCGNWPALSDMRSFKTSAQPIKKAL